MGGDMVVRKQEPLVVALEKDVGYGWCDAGHDVQATIEFRGIPAGHVEADGKRYVLLRPVDGATRIDIGVVVGSGTWTGELRTEFSGDAG